MNPVELEVEIDSLDPEVVGDAEDALRGVEEPPSVERWPRTRVVDPLTILAVVGGVVGLTDALLSLKDRWVRARRSGTVRLRNEQGDELVLTAASRRELEEFLTRSGSSGVEAIRPV